MMRTRERVLAVAIDSADARFVRRLLDDGRLPSLRALLVGGVWGGVRSPTPGGAVWPTFVTGASPAVHGCNGEWGWQPTTMTVARASCGALTPFWKGIARQGRSVTLLDVPFAPALGIHGCNEVSDWGPHPQVGTDVRVSAPGLRRLVQESGVHPLALGDAYTEGPHDRAGVRRVLSRCLTGARQRGDLSLRLRAETAPDVLLVVFSEPHHAGHFLWHTVDGTHPAHANGSGSATHGGLADLFVEIDRQIGRLAEAAGPQARILVFSLHGMQAAVGIPVLGPLLQAAGLAATRGPAAQTWPERVRLGGRALRGGLPLRLKRAYHRLAPRGVRSRLAGPPQTLPAYDWARTAAVSLPTYQNGLIRLNVAGREARGIVHPEQYDATCDRVSRMLREVTAATGAPAVKEVVRTAGDFRAASASPLPDLVVHWTDDALVSPPLRLPGVDAVSPPSGPQCTGQHTADGFFILRPGARGLPPLGDRLPAEEFHQLF